MKHFILLLAILLIFTSCAVKQNTLTQEDVEKTILAQERQMWDRWSSGDPLGFAESFADDATYFDDIAAQTRLDGREKIQKYLATFEGNIPPHTYEIEDPKVQVYGDVAILTFRYHSNMPDSVPVPPWKVTHVYRLINNEWKIVHAHWAQVKEQ
jgi:ketosteroid isomerase-like protein